MLTLHACLAAILILSYFIPFVVILDDGTPWGL